MSKKKRAASDDESGVAVESGAAAPLSFFGEQKCYACDRRAYWKKDGKSSNVVACGYHAPRATRAALPKNPNAGEVRALRQIAHMETVEAARYRDGRPGRLSVGKLRMMNTPQLEEGVLFVFPNYRHDGRTDGLGLAELSPKSMGPIHHGMPGLPAAITLENYHQGAKFWKWELDPATNLPTEEALKYRRDFYVSVEPQRHKHPPEVLRARGGSANVNIPEFSLFYDASGTPFRYTYLQCRYFYCYWYEHFARLSLQFSHLKDRLAQGYHLRILGYDGYEVPPGPQVEVLWNCYNDVSRPFGHELVLYTLLTLAEDRENYPWRRFYRENKALYEGVIPY